MEAYDSGLSKNVIKQHVRALKETQQIMFDYHGIALE